MNADDLFLARAVELATEIAESGPLAIMATRETLRRYLADDVARAGAGSAVLDFGLTMLLQYGLHWDPAYAKALGFVLGTTTAYLINRRWTFRAEPSAARFVAVMLLYLATFAVQVGIYAAFENLWATDNKLMSAVSFAIAQGTATVVNFVVQRAVIFKMK